MLAPGEGKAEPGVTASILESLRSWRQMVLEVRKTLSQLFSPFICRPLRGLGRVLGSVPQARLRLRLGLALYPPASPAH